MAGKRDRFKRRRSKSGPGFVPPPGFELFTEPAIEVMKMAEREARTLQHDYIGMEHLLLGLLLVKEGIAANVLEGFGVEYPRARSAVEFIVARGDKAQKGQLELTPRVKRVVGFSIAETCLLHQNHVGTEHLLLGLIREDEGLAVGVLESMGLNMQKVRAQVMQVIGPRSGRFTEPRKKGAPQGELFDRFDIHIRWALIRSETEALSFNHDSIRVEHLLLALLRDDAGGAVDILRKLGVELQVVRANLETAISKGSQPATGGAQPTSEFNAVLRTAVHEAERLKQFSIGTEHVLLAIAGEENGLAATALKNAGVTREKVHSQLLLLPKADPERIKRGQSGAEKPDKFTERARKVLQLAQEEAHRFNHNYIGTEHLLLGLVREGDGVAARVLGNMGVQLPKVRSAVEFIIGRGEQAPMGEIGLTPRAKKVLELAIDEARRLNHHYIGTEHLLLGLVREGEGIAAGVLESLGVNLEKVRAQVMQVVNQSSSYSQTKSVRQQDAIDEKVLSRFTVLAQKAFGSAREEAIKLNCDSVDTEHLLLGLLKQRNCAAAHLLDSFRTQPRKVRPDIEHITGRADKTPDGEIGVTRHAQIAIHLAAGEAYFSNRKYIGTEHLLSGLIREDEAIAAAVFDRFGVDLKQLQDRMDQFHDLEEEPLPGDEQREDQ